MGVKAGVWAVIVTYNPDSGALRRLIEALAPQVAGLVVVDNASSLDIDSLVAGSAYRDVAVIRMSENFGIAAAQNAGMEHAMGSGAEFIYLSDQDSVPSSTMVAELLSVITSVHARPVAVVGPATVDSRTGQTSPFLVERAGLPRRWQQPSDVEQVPQAVEVGFLISSGTLMPVEVLKRIGGMRSRYFIDHVDTEWCLRARAAGYVLLGIPESRMEHQLGDSVKRIWFFGARQVMYHSPLRDYYMFRNTLLMLRDVPMSWVWRGYFLWRMVQFAGFFLIFADDRLLRLRRMALGLLHGVRGKGGRLKSSLGETQDVPKSTLEP